jgi:hypothetical protein
MSMLRGRLTVSVLLLLLVLGVAVVGWLIRLEGGLLLVGRLLGVLALGFPMAVSVLIFLFLLLIAHQGLEVGGKFLEKRHVESVKCKLCPDKLIVWEPRTYIRVSNPTHSLPRKRTPSVLNLAFRVHNGTLLSNEVVASERRTRNPRYQTFHLASPKIVLAVESTTTMKADPGALAITGSQRGSANSESRSLITCFQLGFSVKGTLEIRGKFILRIVNG